MAVFTLQSVFALLRVAKLQAVRKKLTSKTWKRSRLVKLYLSGFLDCWILVPATLINITRRREVIEKRPLIMRSNCARVMFSNCRGIFLSRAGVKTH
jgi:hypothetical protein